MDPVEFSGVKTAIDHARVMSDSRQRVSVLAPQSYHLQARFCSFADRYKVNQFQRRSFVQINEICFFNERLSGDTPRIRDMETSLITLRKFLFRHHCHCLQFEFSNT